MYDGSDAEFVQWAVARVNPPALVEDRVNFEVMGANEGKHAPSPASMSNRSLRYYLGTDRADEF